MSRTQLWVEWNVGGGRLAFFSRRFLYCLRSSSRSAPCSTSQGLAASAAATAASLCRPASSLAACLCWLAWRLASRFAWSAFLLQASIVIEYFRDSNNNTLGFYIACSGIAMSLKCLCCVSQRQRASALQPLFLPIDEQAYAPTCSDVRKV